jgi:DNA-directed RNA polymerase specialized sigma24 family protein
LIAGDCGADSKSTCPRTRRTEREIFELHYLSGFEAGEIAMIRKQPKAEIESLINKIQLRLREFMRRAAR